MRGATRSPPSPAWMERASLSAVCGGGLPPPQLSLTQWATAFPRCLQK